MPTWLTPEHAAGYERLTSGALGQEARPGCSSNRWPTECRSARAAGLCRQTQAK